MKSHDNTVSNSTSNSDQNLITTDDPGLRLNIGTNDIYVAIFAALLASFPIRSMSIWGHLANGRDLWGGKLSKLTPTWMYDFANYLAYHAFGEVAIAGVKVLMVVAMAVILFHTSRLSNGSIGRRIALACTVLATLAASMRFLAQPATVSYLFLAIAISLVWRKAQGANRANWIWPGWPLVTLFTVWTNVDQHVIIGLVVVGLSWIGQALDRRTVDGRSLLIRRVVSVAILLGVSTLNPSYLTSLPAFGEVISAPALDTNQVQLTSPFDRAYLEAFHYAPAVLAYYPLLALGVLSFLLAIPNWRWMLFLPWLAVAVLSGVQVRAIPLFAIVAGPVLAWNLHAFLTGRTTGIDVRPAFNKSAVVALSVVGVGLLICAWPGWLQSPPFEPRRWAVERPIALERGAAFIQDWNARRTLPTGSRTLHITPDTHAAFRWFCPEDESFFDPKLSSDLASVQEQPNDLVARLKQLGVHRVVLHPSQRGLSATVLNRMLLDPDHWPLLHIDNGLVILGYRDEERIQIPDPFAGQEIDLNQRGYQPTPGKKAPSTSSTYVKSTYNWIDAFQTAAPPRPVDRDEALTWLQVADAAIVTAPVHHLQNWESLQVASLCGLPGGWVGLNGLSDAALRLTLFRPPLLDNQPETPNSLPVTQQVFQIQQRYVFKQGDVSPAILYCAVRAARRSLATNPNDATTFLLLAKCYIRLQESSSERAWVEEFPQYLRLRRVQATTALNRAVELNPQLAEAHLLLSHMYRSVGCMDLALSHLKSFLAITKQVSKSSSTATNGEPRSAQNQELDELQATLNDLTTKFTNDAGRSTVADRALLAARRGLIGTARDILLSSDVSAFGTEGTKLELELLLVTGRAWKVLEWATPEIMDTVGRPEFHWLRAQAHAAVGDYQSADMELANLAVDRNAVSPQQVANGYAQIVGGLVLEERVGMQKTMGNLIAAHLGRMDFKSSVTDVSRILGKRSDASTLRGILSLEAGETDLARDAFQAALAASSSTNDGLKFPGRTSAQDSLRWIDLQQNKD